MPARLRPADPAAVTESFVLKLLSLSGFHPALTACAVCGTRDFVTLPHTAYYEEPDRRLA